MPFHGARVLSFESRRANEMAELIRINGGDPLIAPALVEVPLEQNSEAFAFGDRLYAGGFDMVILLTGVGTRLLARILSTREPADRFIDSLRNVTVVVRGPKPAAVLREWQVPISLFVPEPNTWREVLQVVSGRSEQSVAVQEYGRSNSALIAGLEAQGRLVTAVPVYQWQLPPDLEPLERALQCLLEGTLRVTLFTTGVQIDHFLQVAERGGKREAAVDALRQTFVGSIGPDCTEALQSHGIAPSFEPSHSKMGILVREASNAYGQHVTSWIEARA